MALLEATLLQKYADQECVNRFYYQSVGTTAGASLSFLLMRALGALAVAGVYPADKLMAKIAGIQVAAVQFVSLTTKVLYSATDFFSQPFIEPLNGALAGEGMSPTIALGFRTSRTRLDIHRATKRYVGVSETISGIAGLIDNTFLTTAMAALATEMTAVKTEFDEANTITFTPVVLGKQRYNPDTGLPDANGRAYRIYPVEADQLEKVMTSVSWSAYDHTRTQTSRQFGRGR